ncbi:MAG: DUF1232 domain-containing protein [Anaerolineales bacterium]|nr:DUF1232 domain-containing protein [Anaerolineales bacterium]
MSSKKNDSRSIIPSQGGMFRDLILRIKLILRLMADRRVNPFLKLIPIASLVYVVSPIDLVSGVMLPVVGALDDAAILGFGVYLFLELCPPQIVQEHIRILSSNLDVIEQPDEDVIDAEVVDLPDDEK